MIPFGASCLEQLMQNAIYPPWPIETLAIIVMFVNAWL
jgi:hypothetical protein